MMANCPKCSKNSTKCGSYRINRTSTAQRRFYCKSCNYTFTERNESFRKKNPEWINQQILRLYNKEKGYVKKFDCKKKKTYSTREIAKMLEVSKSFVHKIISETHSHIWNGNTFFSNKKKHWKIPWSKGNWIMPFLPKKKSKDNKKRKEITCSICRRKDNKIQKRTKEQKRWKYNSKKI